MRKPGGEENYKFIFTFNYIIDTGFFVWLSMTVGLWKDSNEEKSSALCAEGKNSSEGFETWCLPLDWCDCFLRVIERLN